MKKDSHSGPQIFGSLGVSLFCTLAEVYLVINYPTEIDNVTPEGDCN